MGSAQRRKGKAYEVYVMNAHCEVCGEDTAARSLQSGKGGICGADVDAPPFGYETKHVARFGAGLTKELEDFCRETESSRLYRIPVFFWKLATRKRYRWKTRVILMERDWWMILQLLKEHDLLDELRRRVLERGTSEQRSGSSGEEDKGGDD